MEIYTSISCVLSSIHSYQSNEKYTAKLWQIYMYVFYIFTVFYISSKKIIPCPCHVFDIVLSDKECAVDNQTNQSKHAKAIKGESNLKKGGGRLIFVKKATNNFYYRPSSSPKKLNNENDEKLTHKNKLSDLNKSININPTNIATENVEYFNITTPKPEKCQTVNYEKSDEENIEKDGLGFFKRGTSALSSLRKSLKRKLNPSSNVQNIPSNTKTLHSRRIKNNSSKYLLFRMRIGPSGPIDTK